jgi:hypothetical protein
MSQSKTDQPTVASVFPSGLKARQDTSLTVTQFEKSRRPEKRRWRARKAIRMGEALQGFTLFTPKPAVSLRPMGVKLTLAC